MRSKDESTKRFVGWFRKVWCWKMEIILGSVLIILDRKYLFVLMIDTILGELKIKLLHFIFMFIILFLIQDLLNYFHFNLKHKHLISSTNTFISPFSQSIIMFTHQFSFIKIKLYFLKTDTLNEIRIFLIWRSHFNS